MIGGAVLSYSRGSKETLRRRVPARGAGTHQGRSRRENARQTACHAQADRGKMNYTIQVRRRGGGHGRQRQQTVRLGDEGRRGARPRRERPDQDEGHSQVVPERLRTLDHARPWRDNQFAACRVSSSRDMSR